ncbi:MAG: BatA domain-containing protein [Brevinematia bacterium]
MIEFLNPFLWGLVLSLIPILIYLFKFITRKTYLLPTLKLIEESKKARGISINLELLSVVLRALMIALIVLIFSQPLLSDKKKGEILVILDTTYSAKANFNKYIKYLKEYITSISENTYIRVIDLSGNEIVGIRKEVEEKIRFYVPRVSKLEDRVIKRIQDYSKKADVIILTDGQKSFLDALEKVGVKGKVITFPFALPYGSVKFHIWKKFGSAIEFKYEINTEEECFAEILLEFNKNSKVLLSSKVNGRKVGEMKVNAVGEGMGFIKSILSNSKGTNEFVEPVYFFDDNVEVIPSEEIGNINSALKSLGIKTSRNSRYKIVIGKTVNSDTLRDSIIIPYDDKSRVIVRGESIFTYGDNNGSYEVKEHNFSTISIIPFTNFRIPAEIEVYGVNGNPIAIFDRSRNNIILLGKLNYSDIELPWFIKETLELLLVDSKVEFVYPYDVDSANVSEGDGKLKILLTPNEEVSEVIKSNSKDEDKVLKKENWITLLLFCIFAIILLTERIISAS